MEKFIRIIYFIANFYNFIKVKFIDNEKSKQLAIKIIEAASKIEGLRGNGFSDEKLTEYFTKHINEVKIYMLGIILFSLFISIIEFIFSHSIMLALINLGVLTLFATLIPLFTIGYVYTMLKE